MIELEILDCKVLSFKPGLQMFESSMLDLDERLIFPFTNYTQTPNCNFNVDYTVTLIEKPFASNEQPPFDILLKG